MVTIPSRFGCVVRKGDFRIAQVAAGAVGAAARQRVSRPTTPNPCPLNNIPTNPNFFLNFFLQLVHYKGEGVKCSSHVTIYPSSSDGPGHPRPTPRWGRGRGSRGGGEADGPTGA